jgi:rhodanese-related sulfurtransferase
MWLSRNRKVIVQAVCLLLGSWLVFAVISCGDAGTSVEQTSTATSPATTPISRDQIFADRAANLFSSTPGQDTDRPGNLWTAAQLQEKLNNPEEADGLFLLDTRPREEWDSQGHIDGATWIKMQEVAEPENLARLPKDKLIVCISPTGHTAVQVSSVLRWLGYDTVILEFGMAGWIDTPARQILIDDVNGGIANHYPVAVEPPYTQAVPDQALEPLQAPPDSEIDVLAEAAQNLLHDDVFAKEYPFNNIFAGTLYQRLTDPALKNGTFTLDIRPLDVWESVGHIDIGSHLLIDWRVLGEPQNLAQLPKDKLIVVVGSTGETAGQVTPILRMLGYDTVTLRSGMTAWTETPDSQRTLNALVGVEYPVVH